MSLKRMMTKLALAFVAAKGVQAFQQSGGIEGVKRKLQQSQRGTGAGASHTGTGTGGGLGGLMGGGGSGGLGGLLGQLGLNTSGVPSGTGTGHGRTDTGLGGLLGGLAGAAGGAAAAGKMRGLLDTTRSEPAVAPDSEETAGVMIRAMVMAAKADGEIDAQEQAALQEIADEGDPSDLAFLRRALEAPVDAEGLARDVPQGLELEVYTAAVMAIEPDNRAEAEFLHSLAEAMALDKATVNSIHEANNKPPLYTL
ncbi:DUF533 domain-containing protein [Rhodobacteraceae bacterium CCMM004]|nr:DUF533 domain-containing protein [Rhodobacteraceae bacterium CCMM004]